MLKCVNESVLEVIITEHNAVVLPYLPIQNGGEKACLAALMWIRQQKWIRDGRDYRKFVFAWTH